MSDAWFYFLQQTFNGLTIGSTYALIAIGYTLVYGIIGMINFAHGEIYMIGSYISFVVLALLTSLGFDNIAFIMGAAFFVSIVITSCYGYSIERIAYRPLRGSNRLLALISAIGMSIFLQNYVRIAQGSRDISMPKLLDGVVYLGSSSGSHVVLSYMQIIIFVVTFFSMTALTIFISRSRVGRACRACSEDIKMAGLLGIDTNRIIAFTFILGASMAAIAGVLLSMYYGIINPYLGFSAGLKAFTAAVLGGIGSIPGAVLGGLILGISEAITAGYFNSEYKDLISFALLILILLVRPTGILGKPEVEKV